MSHNIDTAKIAGNPDINGCSQSYDVSPEDPVKKNTHGDLHLSVSIKDVSDSTQSIFIIRGIAAQIQKKYYDNTEDKRIEGLTDAIKSTVDTYQKDIEISSAVILKDTAYIVIFGTAEVLLKRGDSLAVFNSPNGAIFRSAGKLKNGDLLILATKAFANNTPRGVLNAALEKTDPNKIVEFLAPAIQSQEDNSTICASFIRIRGDIEPQSAADEYPKINTHILNQNNEVKKQTSSQIQTRDAERPQTDKKSIFDRIRSKRFYIKDFQDEKANKRRKLFSVAGLVLMIVLAGTVSYGLHKKSEKEKQERIDKVSSNIERNLQEAEEIFSYSPERAQELIANSREELQKLKDPELNAEEQLVSLQQRIDSAEGSVLGMHSPEANDFLDLDLLSSGFSGEKISVYNDEIYVLDTSNERLIRTNASSKRSEVLAGKDELEGVKQIAIWSDQVYVLKDDGIYDLDNDRLLESDWSENSMIETYIGNLYLLDKENSEIFRYSIEDGDLTSRTSWLTDEVTADFSNIMSWDIDGAIWLSSSSGSVFKYTFGYQQNFTLGKVAPELTSAAIIYASDDNDNIYLLDRDNSRILTFNEEGDYLEQYNQEMIKDAKDIAVFENEGKIILLTGDKLKYIEIE